MSEYQYYEFQAVDRPLSKHEMAELRTLSTRATITPTRFVNFYNWGNFRGNPSVLMDKYFDAFQATRSLAACHGDRRSRYASARRIASRTESSSLPTCLRTCFACAAPS